MKHKYFGSCCPLGCATVNGIEKMLLVNKDLLSHAGDSIISYDKKG